MIRFSIPALALGAALFSIQPADACHRFHIWRYPYPQRCDGAANRSTLNLRTVPPTPDRSYYVEIITAPKAEAPSPPAPREAPLETDLRAPDQIKDFDEHYIELDKHKGELNFMLDVLHRNEKQ